MHKFQFAPLQKTKISISSVNQFNPPISSKPVIWAKKIPIAGNEKTVLLRLAEISDEYGRFSSTIPELAQLISLPTDDIKEKLNFLLSNRIIASLDGWDKKIESWNNSKHYTFQLRLLIEPEEILIKKPKEKIHV